MGVGPRAQVCDPQITDRKRLVGTPVRFSPGCLTSSYVRFVIPLPRAWLLTSALLVGCAAGQIAAILTILFHVSLRPDVAVGLVIAVPSIVGLLLMLIAARRWASVAGAFILAMAPGWLSVLVLTQLVSHG